jgi:hypothetical protein
MENTVNLSFEKYEELVSRYYKVKYISELYDFKLSCIQDLLLKDVIQRTEDKEHYFFTFDELFELTEFKILEILIGQVGAKVWVEEKREEDYDKRK